MKLVLVVFLFYANSYFAQVDSAQTINEIKSHISFLASDSLKGRNTGSYEEIIANNYVRDNWAIKKRKSKILTWNYQIITSEDTIQSQMIGSFIDNKSKQTLVIGAHIDHIGLGGELSKSYGKNDVHNGADDNASGVAILIELQRYYSIKKLPFNMLFIAFTGHEIGTFGAEYITKQLTKKYGEFFCMLNFDMIGRMDIHSKKLFVSCSDQLSNSFTSSDIVITLTDNSRLTILDTKHFVQQGIPSATFTTGMHDDYHRISDDSEFINYSGMYETLLFLENWINTQAAMLMK
jgi:Zn-dependent M28 family amino/carboxypeptidase